MTTTEQTPARLDETDLEGATRRVLRLADELETEDFADVKPWMVARLIRVAVADNLAAGFSPDNDTARNSEG